MKVGECIVDQNGVRAEKCGNVNTRDSCYSTSLTDFHPFSAQNRKILIPNPSFKRKLERKGKRTVVEEEGPGQITSPSQDAHMDTHEHTHTHSNQHTMHAFVSKIGVIICVNLTRRKAKLPRQNLSKSRLNIH